MKKPNKPAAEAFMGCGSAPPVTSAGSESVVSASSVGNGVAGVFVVLPAQGLASTVTVVLISDHDGLFSCPRSEITAGAGVAWPSTSVVASTLHSASTWRATTATGWCICSGSALATIQVAAPRRASTVVVRMMCVVWWFKRCKTMCRFQVKQSKRRYNQMASVCQPR